MNIMIEKSAPVPCFFEDVKLGEVFWTEEIKDVKNNNPIFFLKIEDCRDSCALCLSDFQTKCFNPITQVFTAKSDLFIDISQNA